MDDNEPVWYVPQKIINIVKAIYDGFECAVVKEDACNLRMVWRDEISNTELLENLIARLDGANLEFSLLGEMNADMASTNYDYNVRQLTNIADIYDLSQLISEPTWISGKLEKNRQFCLKL